MNWSEPRESSPQLNALVELSRGSELPLTAAELDAGFELVAARLAAHRSRRRRLTMMFAAAALVISGLGIVQGRRWLDQRSAPLAYSVQGGSLLDAGYLREDGSKGVTVTFEEGTRFALAPGARARLRAVTRNGARLGLEGGTASFEVTPDASRQWEVEVGPFLVQVKGTAFDVSWQPEAEQFELNLSRGKVLVSGPVFGGELSLHGGQHLVVHLRRGETRITEGDTHTSLASTLGANPSTSGLTSAPPAGDQAPAHTDHLDDHTAAGTSATPSSPATAATSLESTTAHNPQREWARAMARGEWRSIVRDAESSGIQTIMNTASAEDLFTLANAARYTQRSALARDTLHALRRRFPRSARIADATFLLGRVEESLGELRAAESHYEEYAVRAPEGTYAAEALGRKMTIAKRTSGQARSRSLALEYLRRFPDGSYAESARAITRAH